MPDQPMPALFLSHGAPTLVIEDCPARDFLGTLGQELPRPRAIVVVSAHYEAPTPLVGAAPAPHTIHDFTGFPDELYRLEYPAPGDPDLARDIASRLIAAGFAARADPGRGLDHGIWNPLMLLYPKADIPVVPLSILPGENARAHYEMGRALSRLRHEGVLLIGSGSITHNLHRFFGGSYALNAPAEPFAREFADWLAERASHGDVETLLKGVDSWPLGRENHPTDDHILPFFFALGAGGKEAVGCRLHSSMNYGVLAMDIIAFGYECPIQNSRPVQIG